MDVELLKYFIITIAVQIVLHTVQLGALCPDDNCLTGGFFFAPGKNMVNNHALRDHVFDNFTVTRPIECFRKCRCDCRCISFNYLTNVNENNCELNEENRHTNFTALKFVEGSQYYDLTINYDIRVRRKTTCLSTDNPFSSVYFAQTNFPVVILFCNRPIFLLPIVRTDVVQASPVLMAGPVTKPVTSQANDSPAHASLTSQERSAKQASLALPHM